MTLTLTNINAIFIATRVKPRPVNRLLRAVGIGEPLLFEISGLKITGVELETHNLNTVIML
jgi:hypothetical protein